MRFHVILELLYKTYASKGARMADVIIQVSKDGKHLVTSDGRTIYRFVPMKSDPDHLYIPWGGNWPPYLVEFIATWSPLIGVPKAGAGVKQEDLSDFDRDGPPDEGLTQISYRGWWLYVYPNAAPDSIHDVPKLFQLVSPSIAPLRVGASIVVANDGDDVGGPGPFYGGP
jgi:hypothetical protein